MIGNLCAYFGNTWVGMFIKSNNEKTFVPPDCSEKFIKIIEENLKTEVAVLSLGESNLLGIYMALNTNGAVLPNTTMKEEAVVLKEHGLNVYVSNEKHNAHGNNIVVNDNGGLINERVSTEEKRKIEDVLGVELLESKIAGYNTVGSACLATNRGFLAHYAASEKELRLLKETLKVPGNVGTVNIGVGFISYGVIANTNGYVAGEKTSGFELGRVEEALGLIKNDVVMV